MADAQDLKSWASKMACGFKSRLRHHFFKQEASGVYGDCWFGHAIGPAVLQAVVVTVGAELGGRPSVTLRGPRATRLKASNSSAAQISPLQPVAFPRLRPGCGVQ